MNIQRQPPLIGGLGLTGELNTNAEVREGQSPECKPETKPIFPHSENVILATRKKRKSTEEYAKMLGGDWRSGDSCNAVLLFKRE